MSAATTGAVGTIVLAGDLTGSATSPVLIPSGVVPGTIRPNNVWIDNKGRILKVNTLSDAQLTALSVAIPDATTSSLGKVQIGTNIGVSAGVISIPDATDTVKGVMKVTNGNGLDLTAGTLSISANATTSVKGIVQIGANIGVSAGVISIPDATDTVKGILKVTDGGGLLLTSGTLSHDGSISVLNTASNSVLGKVQIGTNIDVTSGLISVANASGTTVKGVIKSANSNNLTIVDGVIDLGSSVLLSSNVQNTFTKSQVVALTTQTFAASFTPNFLNSNIITTTLTSNITTLNLPTNTVDGGVYSIILNQDATGSRTISGINGSYKNNETITLSTTANSIDILTIIRISSTEFILILTNRG